MPATSLAEKVEALRRSSVFGALPEASLERLAATMHEVDAPAGQVLIEPGQRGSGMFVLVEGAVEVEARGPTLRELSAGDVVGEIALLTRDGTRNARVRAKTPVRCLALDRASFEDALHDDPELALALLDVVAARLADAGAAAG